MKKITELNIPTGLPLYYKLRPNFMPINNYYFAEEKV
jgi:bisphosphoglycerate-dependent phosphoglycerate mutase